MKRWRLEGYDTFSNEEYPLGAYGEVDDYRESYPDYASAHADAIRRLDELDRTQSRSGGQGWDGIQDRVYIVHPDGRKERVLRSTDPDIEDNPLWYYIQRAQETANEQ